MSERETKTEPAAKGGPRLKEDLLLVTAVMGLILGGVGAFLAFQNRKQVANYGTDLDHMYDAVKLGDEVQGTNAERITSVERMLGLSGQDTNVDMAEQYRLLRRDVQEVNKRVTRILEGEEQLRDKLAPVVSRLEDLDNRMKKLERAGMRPVPKDGAEQDSEVGIPRPGEEEGR